MRIPDKCQRFLPLLFLLCAIAALWSAATQAAVTINEGSRTFVIRQGTQQISVVGLVACPAGQENCDRVLLTIGAGESELRARVTNPLPTPTRTFSVRTGSGIGIVSPRTLEECRQIPRDRLTEEGKTRTSGGNVLSCQMTVRYSSLTTQPHLLVTLNYIANFKPGTTPPVEPATLPAPTGARVTVLSDRVLRWQWNVVPDAVGYVWEFCRGAGCTNFATPVCTEQLSADHTLALNATARFRVRAARSRDCSTGLGTWSDPIQGTTIVQPGPNDPPNACNGLVCQITWLYPYTPNPESFRIWWARSAATIGVDSINSVAINNPLARSVVVTMPSGGVWYFGGKAFTAGQPSELSNVIVRTVQ